MVRAIEFLETSAHASYNAAVHVLLAEHGRSEPHAGDLSGFQSEFVGWRVEFFGLPDIQWPSAISNLRCNCRVCRVFKGVEGPRDSRTENSAAARLRCRVCGWRPFLDSSWTPGTMLLATGWAVSV